MTATGRIVFLDTRTSGDVVAVAAAAGVTTLTVNESVDFADEGGLLVIGDSTSTVTYLRKDEDTNTLTLASPGLPVAVEVGDPVNLWDAALGAPILDYVAKVAIDGQPQGLDFTVDPGDMPSMTVGAMVEVDGDNVVGLIDRASALRFWDKDGNLTLGIDGETGSITMKGALTSGSTITGSLFQTSASVNTGIKIDSASFRAYDSAGTQNVTIDTSGRATFLGELGTAPPSELGIFMYSAKFSRAGVKVTSPILQFNSGASVTQPKIVTDSGRKSGIFVFSGRGTNERAATLQLDNGSIMIGIEQNPGDGLYDGTRLSMWPSGIILKASEVAGKTQTGYVSVGDTQSLFGYSGNGFSTFQGASINLNGTFDVKTADKLRVLSADGTAWKPIETRGLFDMDQTGSTTATAIFNAAGRVTRQGSSERYKHDVTALTLAESRTVLDLQPVRYHYNEDLFMGDDWYPGLIAERLHEAGADLWVIYDEQGRPDGVRYPELVVALIEVCKDQETRLAALEGTTP